MGVITKLWNQDKGFKNLRTYYFHSIQTKHDVFGIDKVNGTRIQQFNDCLDSIIGNANFIDMKHLKSGSIPPDSGMITFDDGFKDNIEVVLPIVEQRKIPITLFITWGFISGDVYPYEYILSDFIKNYHGSLEFVWQKKPFHFQVSIINRHKVYDEIRLMVKFSNLVFRRQLLEQVVGPDWEDLKRDHLFISPNEIDRLRNHPLISWGIHSYSHFPLRYLDRNELGKELEQPLRELREIANIDFPAFSYPYGYYSTKLMKNLKRSGYKAAFTTKSTTDPFGKFEIPRFKWN